MLRAELTDAGIFGSMPRYGDLCIHAALDLRRAFSRAELERAVGATVRDVPVLGCRYEARFWRDRWARVEGPLADAVQVVEGGRDVEEETIAWVRRPLDATRDRPFRLVSMRRGGGSRLLFSVLHLAVDGAGMAAIAHVLGAHLHGVAPSLPVDPRRDAPHVLERVRWYHAPVLARDLVTTLLMPLRVRAAGKRERPYPARAAADRDDASPRGAGGARFRHLAIDAAEVARLKDRCREGCASVNDVLIAALARVAAGRSGSGPVPVLYTMDLRRYATTPRLTATNASSILTVLLPRDAVGDLATTAAAVAAITAGHRRGLAGPAFMLAPFLLGAGAPHALVRRMVRALHPVVVDAPFARGLVVTNVGKLDEGLRAFDPDVEDVHIIGPSIEGVPIPAVVAFGFRGQLRLELFAPPGLAPEALDDLAGEIRAALELPAEGASGATSMDAPAAVG